MPKGRRFWCIVDVDVMKMSLGLGFREQCIKFRVRLQGFGFSRQGFEGLGFQGFSFQSPGVGFCGLRF